MPSLIADRFVACGRAAWIDIASGAIVRLRLAAAASPGAQLLWNDECAALSTLRHPLLNELVDYGLADARTTFEAYSTGPASGQAAGNTELLTHGVRFLEAHGIRLDARRAQLAMRGVASSREARRTLPVGVVLQRRRAADEVAEILGDTAPGGVGVVHVAGELGSGMRTLRSIVARNARVQGYVPVSAGVLFRMPHLFAALLDRHLCVIAGFEPVPSASITAGLLARLGGSSARRHLLIQFKRDAPAGCGTVVLDPLSVTAMVSMVFIPDRRRVLAADALHHAARRADGNPGRFLASLHAAPFPEAHGAISLVRESAAAYVVPSPSRDRPPRTRVRRSLEAAEERARKLAARGRHASAARLLTRASSVLERRGSARHASRCAEALGWILRARGRTAAAIEHFHRAQTLARDGVESISSTIALGITWTDDCRFAEAEAALRSAISAATLMSHDGLEHRARLGLSRCLYWQQRHAEAASTLDGMQRPPSDLQAEASALAARIALAQGDVRRASLAALQSDGKAETNLRVQAVAARAAALVHVALGDRARARDTARRGIAAAAAAHVPLVALRLRAILLSTLDGESGTERQRLVSTLRTALARGPLPLLFRRQLEAALASPAGAGGAQAADPALDDVQTLLEIAFAAADDRAAAHELCRKAWERLRAASVVVVSACGDRRVLAQAGRPWSGDRQIVDRTLAAGAPCQSAAAGHLREAATPITYGGRTVAVVACRWTAASDPDAPAAARLLRAIALAAGPTVRALLDRTPPSEPDPVWREFLGAGPHFESLRAAIGRAARAPFPVLVEGESGSGKELVARAIHRLGSRRDRKLCAVNCAAISEELLEAELFGHARGAFTGAIGERAGLFEEADGGTLFLDEVAELSPRGQAKLLRALQDGEVRRVGESFSRRVDARVIAATNRRLEEEVAGGRFRGDLRFRLDVVRIVIPPLRDRQTDIPILVAHFWEEAARRVESRAALAPETIEALTRYEWPGNVRQLQNVIASLAVHAPRRGRIPPSLLPAHIAQSALPTATTYEAARQEFERRFVAAALARAGGRRGRAARALGVTRQGLAKMLRRLRIDA